MFIGFKNDVKNYKIWDPKDKKFILRRDVTFDEVLIVNSTDSQQVESKRPAVESDATPPPPVEQYCLRSHMR